MRRCYANGEPEFDRISKQEAQEAWQVGPNQMGSMNSGERSASEAQIVQANFQTRIGYERARCSTFYVSIAEVTAGLLALYGDFDVLGTPPRSNVLKPFIATEGDGLISMTDAGDDDNGTDYAARIVTKPYTPTSILNRFNVLAGSLLGKAQADATVEVTLTQDFGLNEKTVSVDLDPTGAEAQVIKKLDNLSLGAMTTVQIEFADPDAPGTRWELNQLALKTTGGQTA